MSDAKQCLKQTRVPTKYDVIATSACLRVLDHAPPCVPESVSLAEAMDHKDAWKSRALKAEAAVGTKLCLTQDDLKVLKEIRQELSDSGSAWAENIEDMLTRFGVE